MTAVEVPLSAGYVALVDAEDAARVLAFKWTAQQNHRTVYAFRKVRRPDGGRAKLTLHKFLTGYKRTDHRNGNGLDNRRSNLRDATAEGNNRNRRRSSVSTSGFKGVSRHKHRGKWQAYITADGPRRHLGYFPTPEEAARAYDDAARQLHGEYAALNFPTSSERAA